MGLFAGAQPLADRMRPQTLEEFVGQEELIGDGTLIRRAIENDSVGSMIFWGPPGSGKTTLAKVIANSTNQHFVSFSAVLQGVKDVREIVAKAKERMLLSGIRTILFVDEIHRFNKSQQDAFLPHVESGAIILIGATTENPSFSINNALLSRCRTYALKQLTDENISSIVSAALADEVRGLGALQPVLTADARSMLVNFANGDARTALGALELAVTGTELDADGKRQIEVATIKEAIASRTLSFDKGAEEHYNLISALHKSIRGSDPQAALYWLSRMLQGGVDPMYLCRRLVRIASEDIGLADPNALVQAVTAKDAVHFLGMPEADTALAQVVVYLATAPKSNSLEVAILAAGELVRSARNDPVPLHIRNAPTKLMADLGYNKRYKYDHDFADAYAGQDFFPESLLGTEFYSPHNFGFEREIRKRLDYWEKLKRERQKSE